MGRDVPDGPGDRSRPSTTLEATVHVRRRPAPGWLACRAATRHITGALCEEDMDIWDSAGNLVAQSRQLTLLTPDQSRTRHIHADRHEASAERVVGLVIGRARLGLPLE
ncbi:MAG: thioesterase family protein [Actinomadura sp.]